ncbi:assimilatory nitrate reductase catalytic subunit NasC [Gracilibacillus kekensis]|uniref:Assimilatory nitrate reductase (NADH) alpha subunit apoprotein n=1 Tax=Gracilibacillus kekensis TaxID=1027249 RepID=A0A1M7MHR8_9BACI|nr:nitrate reductase [Gracilibacillus kekensis]SHM90403.1 assimilatory nitrate reductase (NADH) alpha subunit apoprotein [Gracilibacillus kekensis]
MTELMLKYFRDKQQKVQSEKIYDTQCPYCSMQCKMQLIEQRVISRKKHKTVGKDNPTSEGRLCVKGMNAHQHALHTDRIKQPLRKVNGEFKPISWEEAYQLIVERYQEIKRIDGKDALSVYGSASITNEEAYLLGKFARVGLQTRHIDYNGRLCMASAATGANLTFGMDRGFTNTLGEIPHTRCIILAGTNIAECQPTIMPYFEKAKENGAYIIAIDPRETSTTNLADLHLKNKPGTDVALASGILKILIDLDLVDHKFIQQRTEHFEDVKKYIQSVNLDTIATDTGISLDDLYQTALVFGRESSGMIFTARGVEQQINGTDTVRSFLNLLLVTGKIGKKYSGYGAITGQGNGQGAREHGQKADQLPGYRSIEKEEDRKYIAKVWGIEEQTLPRKGVSAYEMFEKIIDGEITSMFVMCSNPIVSNPNANLIQKALKKLKFLVVVDLFLSETAKLADLVLPTTSYLEDEGTLTNVEGRVMLREASYPIQGEAKHDWEILCDIARLLGKGSFFNFKNAEEIFEELRIASKGGKADYSGITYDRIRKKQGILWPCTNCNTAGTERLFETNFAHENGKAKMAVIPISDTKKPSINNEFPLYLTTGRVMSHYLTGEQTRKSPSLAARNFEAFLEIHPDTAELYGIKPDSLVRVTSKKGWIIVRSKWSTSIRRDTVFVPFHWTEKQNVNRLVDDTLDPYCRMPGFKMSTVRISPIN